jgi:hypothetical protein
LLPTLRLRLSLGAASSRRRATSLLLLLLLLRRLLVLLWRRRLTMSALHSFSLGAGFIHLPCTSLGRDLLLQSGRRTSARLAALSCTHRCRRAELYRFIVTLWRILWRLTLPRTLLPTGPWRWLATLLLPL